jgi:hypothetical protein
VSLSFGSASVGTSAGALPAALNAVAPGSLTLYNAGPNAITIGPSGVTAGQTGPGIATIGAGQSVPILQVAGFAPNSGATPKLFAVAATAPSILNWFNGTEVS